MSLRNRSKQVSTFINEIKDSREDLTVEDLESLRKYSFRYLESLRYPEKPWFSLRREDSKCSENLMIAGLSSIRYLEGTIVIDNITASKFKDQAAYDRQNKSVDDLALLQFTLSRTSSMWTNRELLPTILLPMCCSTGTVEHWGMFFAVPCTDSSPDSGYIMWGDSIGISPPSGCMKVFHQFVTSLTKRSELWPYDTEWYIKDVNYMHDKLKFRKQTDGFSCGFYVICAAKSFCSRSCSSYVPKHGYQCNDSLQESRTSVIRKYCMRQYTDAVIDIQKSHGTENYVTNDPEVYRYLREKLLANCKMMESNVSIHSRKQQETILVINEARNKNVAYSVTDELNDNDSVMDLLDVLEEPVLGVADTEYTKRAERPVKNSLDVESTTDLRKWMMDLNEEGHYFGGITCTKLSNTNISMRLRMKCIESRRDVKCQLFATASRIRYSNVWKLIIHNHHNHPKSTMKSRRERFLLKDLQEYSTLDICPPPKEKELFPRIAPKWK